MGKFQMPQQLGRPAVRPACVPRACMLTLCRSTKPMDKQAKRKAQTKNKLKKVLPTINAKRTSVFDLLRKSRNAPSIVSKKSCEEAALREPQEPIQNADSYVQKLKDDIDTGKFDLGGNPWVHPRPVRNEIAHINAKRAAKGERGISAEEALQLVLRPSVFVWAPGKLVPTLHMICPECNTPSASHGWGRGKVLHHLAGQSLYIATNHTCCKCMPAAARSSSTQRVRRRFSADAANVRTLLPTDLQEAWKFVGTGQTLCDRHLMDFVRALSTRSSWSTIAAIVNEMKTTTWAQDVTLTHLHLCEALALRPENTPQGPPAELTLQARFFRNLFMSDFERRHVEVSQELASQVGDEVLVLDWTKSVAARCGGNFMFNVMSGDRKILGSTITATSSPYEVEAPMWELQHRGVCPKVVYVDDECCGSWRIILQAIWPGVAVRLDGLHAIMRLTQTTTSTQHPWHGAFCKAISHAIYTYDGQAICRLQAARARAGLGAAFPRGTISKYIPRVVVDAAEITKAIGSVLESYGSRQHKEMGGLLTPATHQAWANLSEHVKNGCLCDVPGMNMNTFDATENVTIGDEVFQAIRTLRGSSALEGFHTHQKQWLGMFGHHAMDAGLALVTEGTLRWNRKRSVELSSGPAATPLVFAGGILQEINELHAHLNGNKLYPDYNLAGGDVVPPITCLSKAAAGVCGGTRVGRDQATAFALPHTAPNQLLASQRQHTSNSLAVAETTRSKEQTHCAERLPTATPCMSTLGPGTPTTEMRAAEGQHDVQEGSAAALGPLPACSHPSTSSLRLASRDAAPMPATSRRAGCRTCRMVGSTCRLHDHIQWCASNDLPFDVWLVQVYPARKQATRAAADKKAARATGQRGRPKKAFEVDRK